jgi:GAF domain-containing protein
MEKHIVSSPIPSNEAERLRTLRLFRILDSGSENAFDELTRLAASICDSPISLITLLDENRQWFKPAVGLEISGTPRDVAFCAHAITQNDVFVVEDATQDERFADNPLVTSDPSIRFYAGTPLIVADGVSLGTLCVIDRKPRRRTAAQLDALKVLRQAVVTQLQLRRALEDFRTLEALIPMCSWCRSIRSPDGSWSPLHEYVARSGQLTHGVCERCAENIETPPE